MAGKTNWDDFTVSELQCRCGTCAPESWRNISFELMDKVQQLRDRLGFALPISSGYRCAQHPDERKKRTPGAHNLGLAVDIRCVGEQADRVLEAAFEMGCFTGKGISQRGPHGVRFIHLDIATPEQIKPRPWLWSY